jgi:hypothetical protein
MEPEADEVVVAEQEKKIPPSQLIFSSFIAYLLNTAESFEYFSGSRIYLK